MDIVTGIDRSTVEMYYNAKKDEYFPERRKPKQKPKQKPSSKNLVLKDQSSQPDFTGLGQFLDIYT